MSVFRSTLVLVVGFACLCAVACGPTAMASAATCPNAPLRTVGPSAHLPDCRAFELVSPVEKGPASDVWQVAGSGSVAATDGNRVSFLTVEPSPQAVAGPAFPQAVATRGASSWSSIPTAPAIGDQYPPELLRALSEGNCIAYTPDMSECVLSSYAALTPGATEGDEANNLYIANLEKHTYTLLTPDRPLSGVHNAPIAFGNTADALQATPDMGRIVFETDGSYSPETKSKAGSKNVYGWSEGKLQNLGILPELFGHEGVMFGDVTLGSEVEVGSKRNAMSVDGSRVFLTWLGMIWLWERGQKYTRPVSVTEREGGEEFAPGDFVGATADGSSVFFASREKLTADSTAGEEAQTGADQVAGDLYRYDVDSHLLTDLTVDPTPSDTQGAEFQGIVDYSPDGQYIYFVALGRLVPGQGVSGQPNLYLSHDGSTTFIGTLDGQDHAWGEGGEHLNVAMSGSGRVLAFLSAAPLAEGLNNGHTAVYRYDADTKALDCASCDPGGARSTADAGFAAGTYKGGQPNMSSDGARLFFDTADALLPGQDTNGQGDVYELERQGTGSCLQTGGCLYLLSNGKGNEESVFATATPSGEDVFFRTRDQLVGEDTDSRRDLYDARVNGGFPEPAPPPPPCSDEGCRAAPSTPPALVAPGTVGFAGPGNLPTPVLNHGVKSKAKVRPKPGRKTHKKGRKTGRRARKASKHAHTSRRTK